MPRILINFLRLGLSALVAAPAAALPAPAISLARDAPEEQATEAALRELFRRYDVTRWTFVDRLIVDREAAIPFSHPVLTLSPDARTDPVMLLSVYLHENLHWWLDANQTRLDAAIAELRILYPEVPVRGREGARDEYSTYMHLINCWLEIEALTEVAGRRESARILDRLSEHHYTWIYRQVRDRGDRIGAIVRRHRLIPPPRSS